MQVNEEGHEEGPKRGEEGPKRAYPSAPKTAIYRWRVTGEVSVGFRRKLSK